MFLGGLSELRKFQRRYLLAALLSAVACRQRTARVEVVKPAAPRSKVEVAAPAPAASGRNALETLLPVERNAVSRLLASHPRWRLAADSDLRLSADAEDISRLYGTYHPYFVRGDLNDDGLLDFVAAFVENGRSTSTPVFTIAAFFGTPGGGFSDPTLLEQNVALESGDLTIDRDSIVITPDLSQETGRRYRWNPRKKEFEYVSDSADPSDPAPMSRA
jgi:hypothetical protein